MIKKKHNNNNEYKRPIKQKGGGAIQLANRKKLIWKLMIKQKLHRRKITMKSQEYQQQL